MIRVMRREEVQRRLAEHRAELEGLGSVRSISSAPSRAATRVQTAMWTFWSSSTGPVGLFQFFRVQRRLEAIVGRPVDLVMKDAIKSQLRTRILAETVSAT